MVLKLSGVVKRSGGFYGIIQAGGWKQMIFELNYIVWYRAIIRFNITSSIFNLVFHIVFLTEKTVSAVNNEYEEFLFNSIFLK